MRSGKSASNLERTSTLANHASVTTLPDSSDRALAIAAIFMTMLVAWDTAEFALQPVRRPPQTEILVLLTTCAVLAFIPFIRSGALLLGSTVAEAPGRLNWMCGQSRLATTAAARQHPGAHGRIATGLQVRRSALAGRGSNPGRSSPPAFSAAQIARGSRRLRP
jgi:hypothetical protein